MVQVPGVLGDLIFPLVMWIPFSVALYFDPISNMFLPVVALSLPVTSMFSPATPLFSLVAPLSFHVTPLFSPVAGYIVL